MSMFRQFPTLPTLPQAGLLERYLDTLAILVPVARTNLVINPSFEVNASGWTAVGSSVGRSTAQQYHGAYSLAVTPTAGVNDGVYFSPVALTSGVTYAASMKVLGAPGVPYKLAIATTGAVELTSRSFIGTGKWQWIWLFWTETSTNTRRFYLTKNNSASTAVFSLDGAQVEACSTEGVFVTTYIDGDQQGYVANQVPAAYLWNGTPHASTSTRSGQTRAGGRVVTLKEFGFFLSAIIGLGLASPRHEALSFGQLDGAQYQNTLKPQRTLSLVGRWNALDPTGMDQGMARLGRLLDRDYVATRQPAALLLQARFCNEDIGELVSVPRALYASGMEGTPQELPTAAAALTFQQYFPYVVGRDGGASLAVQLSVSNANLIVQRSAAGLWSAMGTGMTGTAVYSILRALDGTIYAGGLYTDAGGSGADEIAQWNGSAWAVVGSATALNNTVFALAQGANGILYAVGQFLNAGGDANADYLAQWNGSAWSAVGTPADAQINAIVIAPNGNIYVGGTFTNIGGSGADRIAMWNGSVWATVGGATAINGTVNALAVDRAGNIYAGGLFTDAGGVAEADRIAKWNGTAWSALGTGMDASVDAIAIGPDGVLYAGGFFTIAGGLSISYIAQWNGVQWSPLGSGVNNNVTSLEIAPDGTLYATGNFTTAGGLTLPDRFARWNGSAWIYPDVDLPSAVALSALLATPDGRLFVGNSATGTAIAAALTTVTNAGSAETYPTLTIRGPTTGSSRVYQLVNTTTGRAIYLNYTILAGETATLVLDPATLSFTSTFQGNIFNTILPGSQSTQFTLQPGANTISFFAADSTVTAVLSWPTRYLMLEDALYAAGDP